jgi:putative spermidine/putrescine transport system permease protein
LKKVFKIATVNKLIFVILVGLPVVAGLLYAFLYSIGVFGILNTTINFSAWKAVLIDIYFWKSIAFSLYVGIISVTISAIISFILAYYWKENFKKGLLAVVIYLPLCFPATVMAFFMFQMLSQSGFLSRAAYQFHLTNGIAAFPGISNDAFGVGIITTMIALITPFFIILFSSVYQAEKIEELGALATTLGATKRQVISKIVIPVLFKKTLVSLLLFVIFVMGNYEVPLLLGRQNPQMISVAIVQKIQRYNLYDIPKGYAMSIIYVTFLLLILGIIVVKNPDFFKPKENND